MWREHCCRKGRCRTTVREVISWCLLKTADSIAPQGGSNCNCGLNKSATIMPSERLIARTTQNDAMTTLRWEPGE